jgi:ubiquinone/menaquinone biosynthesis C-methylase UbiE
VSWSTPGSDTKRLVATAYDRSASGFAGAANRVVYRYLAQPLIDALGAVRGAVLDVAAGAGAAGRHFDDTVALDLSMGQLRHNPACRRVCGDAERLPFRADSFAAAVCVFGINHFPDPTAAVSEMARVASVVGVATWARPEPRYAPKAIVLNTLERHAGRYRSTMGEVVDPLADRVGSVAAVAGLLERAGLNGGVEAVTVTIPWPGTEAFLDYRLSMASTAGLVADERAVRQEAAAALASLAEHELDWHAAVIVGVGLRA